MTWTRLLVLRKEVPVVCSVIHWSLKKNHNSCSALRILYIALNTYLFIAMLSNGPEIEMLKNVLLNKGLTPSF